MPRPEAERRAAALLEELALDDAVGGVRGELLRPA